MHDGKTYTDRFEVGAELVENGAFKRRTDGFRGFRRVDVETFDPVAFQGDAVFRRCFRLICFDVGQFRKVFHLFRQHCRRMSSCGFVVIPYHDFHGASAVLTVPGFAESETGQCRRGSRGPLPFPYKLIGAFFPALPGQDFNSHAARPIPGVMLRFRS